MPIGSSVRSLSALIVAGALVVLGAFSLSTLFAPAKCAVLQYSTPSPRTPQSQVHTAALLPTPLAFRRVKAFAPVPSFFVYESEYRWITEHEQHVMRALQESMANRMPDQACLVVDVGMNAGFFTMAGGALGCRVFSFELQPNCVALAEAAVRVNGFSSELVTIIAQPASNTETSITIPLDVTMPCDGTYSFTRTDFASNPANTAQSHVQFHTTTLASVLPADAEINFLKVDTEGHDPQVLAGAMSFFERRAVAVAVIELQPKMWNPPAAPEHVAVYRKILSFGYSAKCLMWRIAPAQPPPPQWNIDTFSEFMEAMRRNSCVDVQLSRS